MYFSLEIKADGLDVLRRTFAQAAVKIDDFGPAWPAVRTTVLGSFATRFQNEGFGWAPLARSTVRQRVHLGYGGAHPILKRTGELEGSFIGAGAGHVDVATPLSLTIGSSLKRAGWLSRGTAHIPARPIPRLAFAELSAIRRALGQHVHNVVTGKI